MKQVVICSPGLKEKMSKNPTIQTISMDDYPVTVGLLVIDDEKFDENLPQNENLVLVRKRAFSCNYRDKAIIFSAAHKCNSSNASLMYNPVGSDFVADVVAKGKAVTSLEIGDRVIPNDHYPFVLSAETHPGIPSNYASKEYEVFHSVKLMKIPAQMSDEVAASFTIGAQTAYSMVRKLEVKPEHKILVTSAKSNTSLYAIAALKQYGANVYATSTSESFKKELLDMGVNEVFIIDPKSASFLDHKGIADLVNSTGGFNGVIDPFFDLHIGKLIDTMTHFGRYVSCGFYNQYTHIIGKEFIYKGDDLSNILTGMVVKNISLMGNCLGLTSDLQKAIDDHVSGKFDVLIDAVYSEGEETEFFNRTYNAKDRWGKVVYKYNNE